jgi:cytoskeleton protein RodZ
MTRSRKRKSGLHPNRFRHAVPKNAAPPTPDSSIAATPADSSGDQYALALGTSTPPQDRAETVAVDAPTIPSASQGEHDMQEAQTIPAHHTDEAVGQRLRAAREHLELSREDVAARLKLPIRLVARLESDDCAHLDHGVYVRGYLASYARLVGLPPERTADAAGCTIEPVPLVATGTVSRSRYLFERYSVSATYLVLTALIVAPAVWLATHGGLEQNLARTAPLDAPIAIGIGQSDDVTEMTDAGVAGERELAVAAPPIDVDPASPEPIIASMAPFPASAHAASLPAPRISAPAVGSTMDTGVGAHVLTLSLEQSSWIEVVEADGNKLEYDLLPAGSRRSYHSDQTLSVRIGNSVGAEVRADGKSVDLDPYRHANVASLTLFGHDRADAWSE